MKEFALIKQRETKRIAEERAIEIEKIVTNLKKNFADKEAAKKFGQLPEEKEDRGKLINFQEDNEAARLVAVLKKEKEFKEEETRVALKKKLRKKTKRE
jgi:hypothetical protein